MSQADELEAAAEGLPGAVSLAPSSVVPALGGELVVEGDSFRAGLLQAGPLAVAGLAANGANVVVTVLLARLLTTRGYGTLNVLTGLFLIVSMPGSAVIVAVVRRVTGGASAHLVQRWARRMHRRAVVGVVAFAVVVVAAGPWLTRLLNQHDVVGVDTILVAGAVWILLCLDRGLLQAHRSYRALSANLLVEGGVRTAAMLTLVAVGLGPSGAAAGVLIAEVVTAVHARMMADRVWTAEGRREHVTTRRRADRRWRSAFRPDPDLVAPPEEHRRLVVDLVTALVALAMTALLQNIDVIVLGREAPAESGSYAAVSVASKALVFGAVVLGGYLLPEAAIRWREGGHALRQLAVTLLLLGIPTVLLLTVALAAPHLLLSVVFSSRYLGAESAFLPLVLAMICLSITVILTMYLLAVGRRWITGLLVLGAIVATAAVAQGHGVPRTTALADLAVQAGLAVATMIGFALVHHRRLRPS
ncbi:MAG TPA: oligosaccharide flippase family protein [Acidimicrobiales bacterium]|nr:oligosaccharide flippase family protein [Acidimicrobiales bacterium]